MASWFFLALAVWCAGFTWNALHPTRHQYGFVPSFFASWLTIELAEVHLVWEAVATALFISNGALDEPVGWLAAAVMAASWVGLLTVVLASRRTAPSLDGLLTPHGAQRPFSGVKRIRKVQRQRNVTYARVGGQVLKLDVYLPDGPADGGIDGGIDGGGALRPAILQIHGGAWVLGSKREQGIPLLKHLAANGWVGFNANYRLSPGATWPDHLVDLKRALAFIREHAAEYGVDPDFVAVTGGSAGGHLCAMVALTSDDESLQPGFEDADCSVQVAVPFYGVYDFTNRTGSMDRKFITRFLEPIVMKAFFAEEPERFEAASPMSRVHPGAPPFLVLHGDRDVLAPVADAREFVRLLTDVSNEPVVYAELAGAQHAFDIFHSTRSSHALHGVERFLAAMHERYLHGGVETPLEREELAEAVEELEAADASATVEVHAD